MVSGEIQCDLTEDEMNLQKYSTKNTISYQRGKNSTENRFFDTIYEYGNQKLKLLCEDIDDPAVGQLYKKKMILRYIKRK